MKWLTAETELRKVRSLARDFLTDHWRVRFMEDDKISPGVPEMMVMDVKLHCVLALLKSHGIPLGLFKSQVETAVKTYEDFTDMPSMCHVDHQGFVIPSR